MAADRHDETRRAIAVMTAWADGSSDASFSVEQIMTAVREDPRGEVGLIIGLTNLLGLVLTEHQHETERTPTDTLRAIALAISSE